MHSMTGFGRFISEKDGIELTVELKSLNNRYRDFYFRLPESVRPFQDFLRKMIQEKVLRGRVELTIYLKNLEDQNYNFTVDEELLDQMVEKLNHYSRKYFEKNLSFSDLLTFEELFQLEEREWEEEFLKNLLSESLKEALNLLVESRKQEGEGLKKDLKYQLEEIHSSLEKIKSLSKNQKKKIREQLKTRLDEVLKDRTIDEDRLYQEVCIIAERADIHEEIIRLDSHVKYFEKTMDESGEIGRKLDFITQEMNREINTINSKSLDDSIIKEGIEIKSRIEKLKEQVQNIE